MTAEEIIERLKMLLAIPPAERPIPIKQLEDIAGVTRGMVHKIVRLPTGVLHERTRCRFERALLWVENDQVRARSAGIKGGGHRNEYRISAPKPPQVNVTTVKFTAQGPRVTIVAYNPRALKGVPK